MLLGKRPRPPMSRTISMKEIDADLGLSTDSPMPTEQNIRSTIVENLQKQLQHLESKHTWWSVDYPAFRRRTSADLAVTVETAPFLRSCGLCKRSLGLNRDIFMYRGEIAFCSLECRQQLINEEDRLKNSAPTTTSLPEPSFPAKQWQPPKKKRTINIYKGDFHTYHTKHHIYFETTRQILLDYGNGIESPPFPVFCAFMDFKKRTVVKLSLVSDNVAWATRALASEKWSSKLIFEDLSVKVKSMFWLEKIKALM